MIKIKQIFAFALYCALIYGIDVGISVDVQWNPTNLSQEVSPELSQSAGEDVAFTCSYNNSIEKITDATCNLIIDSSGNNMIYNGNTYIFSTNELSINTHYWRCECNKTGYDEKAGAIQEYLIRKRPTGHSNPSFFDQPSEIIQSSVSISETEMQRQKDIYEGAIILSASGIILYSFSKASLGRSLKRSLRRLSRSF